MSQPCSRQERTRQCLQTVRIPEDSSRGLALSAIAESSVLSHASAVEEPERTPEVSVAPPCRTEGCSLVAPPQGRDQRNTLGKSASCKCYEKPETQEESKTEKMHRELALLQEKLGALERKIRRDPSEDTGRSVYSPAASPVSCVRDDSTTSRAQMMPMTARPSQTVISLQPQFRCVPLKGSYRPPAAVSREGKENSRINSAGDGLFHRQHYESAGCVDTEETHALGEIRNSVLAETKHEVLIQLTKSLESERDTNLELRREVGQLRTRCVVMQNKYDSVKQEYDELARNYATSERLREQQKQMIQEMQGSRKERKLCTGSRSPRSRGEAKVQSRPLVQARARADRPASRAGKRGSVVVPFRV